MKRINCYIVLICILIPILLLSAGAKAETQVSGLISSDTTWTVAGSPYVVTGSVLVNSGITLTAQPGVTVKFDSGKALQINGTLIARGTQGNLITFTSNKAEPAPGDWGYILFSDSSADATYDIDGNYTGGSILEYVAVEYAGGANISDNGAVRMNNGHPFINNSNIRNNNSAGIYAWNLSGHLKIMNNTISGNSASYSGGGIYSWGGAVTISNNTISGNSTSGGGGGIYAAGDTVTISNNIITGNSASNGGAIYGGGIYSWEGTVTISNNIISGNSASNGGGVYTSRGTVIISNNTITGNQATGAEKSIVHAGSPMSFTSNNIFNNSATYALLNNAQGSPNLNASNNWWGTANDAEIQAKIYDWFDDSAKGIVDYSPYETAIRTDTPISPPTGLAITPSAGQLALSWSANPESDTTGYIVYWGTEPGFLYANSVDVGNVTSHTISGLPNGTYYVTVTAYDTGYNLANDDPATIVNENQTNGNESWFASEGVATTSIPPVISLFVVLNDNRPAELGGAGWSFYALMSDPYGLLPDNIASATVTGPGIDGELQLEFRDYGIFGLYYYQFVPTQSLTSGSYTVRIEDIYGNLATATDDIQAIFLPQVDLASFSIRDGSTINTTYPLLCWDTVGYQGDLLYIVQIREVDGNYVARTSHTSSNCAAITAGSLNPGGSYEARIDVFDSGFNGRSMTLYISFNVSADASGAGSISGTVTRDSDGSSVQGVWVDAFVFQNNQYWTHAQADAQGNYTISNLPIGEYRVRVWAGGTDFANEHYNEKDMMTADTVTVLPGANTVINFGLAQGGSVAGRVVSESSGAPLQGLWIDAAGYNTWGYVKGVTTGSDGTYQINNLPAGKYRVYCWTCYEMVGEMYDNIGWGGFSTPVEVTAGAVTANIDFALKHGTGIIEGTVRDSATGALLDGRGGPGLGVYIWAADADSNIYVRGIIAGQRGSYRLYLTPGTYHITATPRRYEFYNRQPAGYASQWYDGTLQGSTTAKGASVITVAEGETVSGIDLYLGPSGVISGGVSNCPSTPCVGGIVVYDYATGYYVTSPANRTYDSTFAVDVPPGNYKLRMSFYDPSYATGYYAGEGLPPVDSANAAMITVAEGEEVSGINFTVTSAGSVSGRVIAGADGSPVAGLLVEAFSYSIPVVKYWTSTRTDRDGYYTITNLLPGDYLIVAWGNRPIALDYIDYLGLAPEGWGTLPNNPVTVTVGVDTPGIDFILWPGTTGRLLDNNSQAVSHFLFFVRSDPCGEGCVQDDVLTDQNGYFTLNLPPGNYVAELTTQAGTELVPISVPYEGDLVIYLTIGCMKGDANGDGNVNILDAIYALRIILELEAAPADLCRVDIDDNGVVDITDVINILKLSL